MATVYACQLDIVWEDKRANQAKVEAMLQDRTPERGSLVVLPELFDVGFSLNTAEMSEQVTDGITETWCAELAQRYGVFLQGASVQRTDPNAKATNNAVVFNPDGEIVCRYEKVHPFSGGREPEAYRGGTSLATFTWGGITVCPLICYDLRFPELWRVAVVQYGAEMFTIGASWPSPRQWHWSTLLDARAIENQAYVVAVNRCGTDPYLPYAGGSKVVDPMGRVIVEADDTEQMIVAPIDRAQVTDWRRDFAALDDIHRDLLGEM